MQYSFIDDRLPSAAAHYHMTPNAGQRGCQRFPAGKRDGRMEIPFPGVIARMNLRSLIDDIRAFDAIAGAGIEAPLSFRRQ